MMTILIYPASAGALIRQGSRGSDVIKIQQRLKELGYYSGSIDGIYGSGSRSAVIRFQKDTGLTQDGIVGPATMAKMFAVSASTPPPSNNGAPATTQRTLQNGSRGADVTLLQNKLNSIGFNCGRADGIFGNNTKNAVMAYQRSIGWSADGIASVGLTARLFSTPASPPPPPPPAPQYQDFKPVAGSLNGKVIFLDPGHGGSDPGAVGGSLQEKNINLDMGLRLKRVLEQAGATIILTRSTDTSSSLFYRSALVNHYILEKEIVKLQTDITALIKVIEGLGSEKSNLDSQIATANVQLTQKTILMVDYKQKAAGFKTYIDNPDLSDRKDIFTPVNDKASQDVKETFDLMATEEYVKNFLFISLHVNAMPAGNTTASGAQVYYRGNDGSNFNVVPDYYTNYNTEARQQLSSGILSILTSTMGFSGKYMTPYVDNFSVLRENNLVSCLIELGFISNASDRSILSDQINREKAAGAIYQGIINYFK